MKLISKIINFSLQLHSEMHCADSEKWLYSSAEITTDESSVEICNFKGHVMDPITVFDSKTADKDLLELISLQSGTNRALGKLSEPPAQRASTKEIILTKNE